MSGTKKVVAVTGANGYVGSHIVKSLLDNGYTVRATVRDPKDPKKSAHLLALAGAKERLTLLAAELESPSSVFEEVFRGTSAVIHSAAPVIVPGGGEDDYVKPVLAGIENVMKAIDNVPEVKRIVMTSSWAAVGGKHPSDFLYTGEVWSSEEEIRQGKSWYSLSKNLSERYAWNFVKKEAKRKDELSLVTICPTLVCGPVLESRTPASLSVLLKYLNGENKEISRGGSGFIDVRDVADAHVKLLESGEGRYLMTVASIPWVTAVDVLRKAAEGSKHSIPTTVATEGDVFWPKCFDNTPVKKLLGRELRTLEDTFKDSIKSLEEHGSL